MMDRRDAIRHMAFTGISALFLSRSAFSQSGEQAQQNPWPTDALLGPGTLRDLIAGGDAPAIFCVGFPSLFREKHIPGAKLAGPTSKPEGIRELLRMAKAVNGSQIVLYCGCCPLKDCPNIRPAYEALAKHKMQGVQVLNLPHNFHTDWVAKGYPVQSDAS